MNPEPSGAPSTEQVAAFFRKHRTGLVALVFTDLVDSTALLNQLGDQAGASFLRKRREIIRDTLRVLPEAEEIETAGDSFLLVFSKPSDAVRFALLTQARLRVFSAESRLSVQERIGIHLGEVVISEHETEVKAKDLYGLQLATCARVMSLAQGAQILLTRGVFDSARQVLKGEDLAGVGPLSWVSHGPYVLKGIEEAVEVCEVGEAGQSPLAAPKTSEKAQRQVRPDEEPVLGWRPAVGQEVPNTQWVLEQKLGEGGFGEVWVAKHQTLKERHVFKFCFRADRVRSLKREVTLFRLLKERVGEHAGIVRLHDVYFDQPPFYLEEEYISGKDLKSWCEAQGGVEQVPMEMRLEIVAQAAEALQAAHDAGIIHRDVKPGNILVSGQWSVVSGRKTEDRGQRTEDGGPRVAASEQNAGARPPTSDLRPPAVKLTDFGIGQVISAEYLAGVTKAGFTQTMLGSTSSGTGTTMYLAPEIIGGMPATTRSDIYSLGVVLYQFLIGDFRRPVTTDWAKQVADPLLRDDLEHCFSGNPEERFAGAAQLARSLRNLEPRRAELARQQADRVERDRLRCQAEQRHKIVIVSASVAVLLLLLAIALGYGMRKAERARQLQRRYAYASDMKAAQVAIQQNNRGLGMILLRRCLPRAGEEDLRGLEWRYLWQEIQGDELQSFAHPAFVNTATLAPDAPYLVTASGDGRIRVWETTSARVIREFDTDRAWGPRKSIGFSSDRKWLAFAKRGSIEIRDTSDWSTIQELISAWPPLCFAPKGNRLVAWGTNGVQVWSLSNWSRRMLTNATVGWNYLAFHPDGKRMACCGSGTEFGGICQIELWDLETGTGTTLGKPDSTISLAISPDGKWLASGNRDGEVCLWDLASQRLVERFPAHRGLVLAMAFSPDRQLLATGGNDELIHVWQAGTTNRVRSLHGHQNEIWSLEFSKDGQSLVSASKDGTAKLWGVKGGQARGWEFVLPANSTPIGHLPDGSTLVTLDSQQRMTHLWSVPSGRLIRSLGWSDFSKQGCAHFQHFPANQVVVGVTSNGTVHFWNLKTGAHLHSVQLGGTGLVPQCLSLDSRWLLGTQLDRSATLCDLRAAKRVQQFPGFRRCAAFSPEGRWLAYATNRFIRLWDLTANRQKGPLLEHRWSVESLAFSPEGTLLASSDIYGDVYLWSVDTGKPLFSPLRGHQSGEGSLVFSSDVKTLISGSIDMTMRWWSVATGQEMLLFPNVRWVTSPGDDRRFEWNPGGKALVWQESQGSIRMTGLPTLPEIDAAEKAQAGAMTVPASAK